MCGALRVLDRILGAWFMSFELQVSSSSQQRTSVQRAARVAEGGQRSFAAVAKLSEPKAKSGPLFEDGLRRERRIERPYPR